MMGSDDIFKKRREANKKRKKEVKTPRANSFLIVTEGEKSEPNYIKGISKKIENSIGGAIKIKRIKDFQEDKAPTIDIHGEGASTNKLVEITENLVKSAKTIYQNIWVVFDKDSFRDFDEAIKRAQDKGYQVAWSNQSFEYWLYLHFEYSDSALHRSQWNQKLDEKFKSLQIAEGRYKKNDEKIFEHLDRDNRVQIAISNAKRRMSEFDKLKGTKEAIKASEYDPGTTFYQLVEELYKYISLE